MNYCEHCHTVVEENKCSLCGRRKLREVEKIDYCFVLEKEDLWAKMFMEILKENNIPYMYLPVVGAGTIIKTGGMERYKIYVPYEKRIEAIELIDSVFHE